MKERESRLTAKKSLGQHWLTDESALTAICDAAEIKLADTVLEIGPGKGSLTKYLAGKAGQVIAVEKDEELAKYLYGLKIAENLKIIEGDILKFDLTSLPANYKIVANIPYYLTAHLIRLLTETPNKPFLAVLLVQKEVAQRLAANPGKLSQIAVIAQLFYDVSAGEVVPAKLFTPPPKVDSQTVVLKKREMFPGVDKQNLIRIVKIGFSSPRKKLLNNLIYKVNIPKTSIEKALASSKIGLNARAQELTLEQWSLLASLLT